MQIYENSLANSEKWARVLLSEETGLEQGNSSPKPPRVETRGDLSELASGGDRGLR